MTGLILLRMTRPARRGAPRYGPGAFVSPGASLPLPTTATRGFAARGSATGGSAARGVLVAAEPGSGGGAG